MVKNNVGNIAPHWMTVIPYEKNIVRDIIRIYKEKCPYGKGREVFGIMCMDKRKFAIGGAYVHMTSKQLNAIKILTYNYPKKFSLYHISSYFKFNADREDCFVRMVQEINYQCKRAGREKLIYCNKEVYYISPNIMNY